jgi:hypothetical protein
VRGTYPANSGKLGRCGREFGLILRVIHDTAMRTAGLTGQCTFSVRLVDDRLDGARAAAAFGAAAKGVIDLLGISWRVVGRVHGVANIVVTEDIAGTDDHETRKRPSVMQRHRYGTR